MPTAGYLDGKVVQPTASSPCAKPNRKPKTEPKKLNRTENSVFSGFGYGFSLQNRKPYSIRFFWFETEYFWLNRTKPKAQQQKKITSPVGQPNWAFSFIPST